MKTILSSLAVLFLLAACNQKNTVCLFNGNNLDNWEMIAADENIDPQSLFKVEDGVIKIAGTTNGYLRSKAVFSNYELNLEWRWTENPTNSGVLLHVNGYDFWPNAVEAQLMDQHAGDIVLIGYGVSGLIKDSTFINLEKRFTIVPHLIDGIEKPAGEWNHYRIVCDRDMVTVEVNGILMNEAKSLSLTAGAIGLQSEGSPIEFRNITIKPF